MAELLAVAVGRLRAAGDRPHGDAGERAGNLLCRGSCSPGRSASRRGDSSAGPDFAAGFHVFGVSWRPDRVRFFLDGVLVHEEATPADMHGPMYILANLAVGGVGSRPGPAAGDLSGVFRVAWIRAWQFKDLSAAHQ